MTVKPELRGYKDKDNRKAVYIRIMNKGKRTFKKTDIKVLASEWDGSKVKANHVSHIAYNKLIKELVRRYEAEEIIPGTKYPDTDFFKYCTACLNEWDKTKANETHRQYLSEINKIKEFAAQVKLFSITPDWLNRYKAFCFGRKNSVNTVHKNLKFVRVIVRKAHKERLIEHNPFDIFDMPKYRDPQKQYLTRDQIALIEIKLTDVDLPDQGRFVGTWFCISCATGLRFSDMVQFNKKKHIINDRIILYTMKSGTPVSMPLTDKIKGFLELVDYKGVDMTNIHFNRLLKQIGEVCELPDLSAHVARHSFAMLCANAGISQEVTAKLLGHTSLKSTAIYYKISGLRIDDELKKLG